MLYIGISSKGGVGKSTLISQILSGYFYQKNNKKVELIEIDDENEDSLTYAKSDILNCNIISTSKIKTLDDLFYNEDDYIIDVGGNKTATIFLSELKKINEFDNVTWFIPLGSGEQDNQNALETYNDICKMDDNPKIIFVLSRATTDDVEWEFLNFFGSDFLNTPNAIMKNVEDAKYIKINSNPILNISRYFSKTAYDLSLNKTDFRKKAKEEEDKNKRKSHVFMNRIKNEAIEYIDYLKDDVFSELDKQLTI